MSPSTQTQKGGRGSRKGTRKTPCMGGSAVTQSAPVKGGSALEPAPVKGGSDLAPAPVKGGNHAGKDATMVKGGNHAEKVAPIVKGGNDDEKDVPMVKGGNDDEKVAPMVKGGKSGEVCGKAYCVKCQKKNMAMVKCRNVTSKNGRNMLKGICKKCGTKMNKFI